MPPGYPPRSTVHGYYSKWRSDGCWEKIEAVLQKQQYQERMSNNGGVEKTFSLGSGASAEDQG
jgi:transposase